MTEDPLVRESADEPVELVSMAALDKAELWRRPVLWMKPQQRILNTTDINTAGGDDSRRAR